MNKILQAILLNMGKAAASTVPGGSVAVGAAEGIIAAAKSPGKADDVDAIFAGILAGVSVLEGLGGHFAEEPGFQAGLYQIKGGATLVAASIKAHKAALGPTPSA
jgi:hypothetical protein